MGLSGLSQSSHELEKERNLRTIVSDRQIATINRLVAHVRRPHPVHLSPVYSSAPSPLSSRRPATSHVGACDVPSGHARLTGLLCHVLWSVRIGRCSAVEIRDDQPCLHRRRAVCAWEAVDELCAARRAQRTSRPCSRRFVRRFGQSDSAGSKRPCHPVDGGRELDGRASVRAHGVNATTSLS